MARQVSKTEVMEQVKKIIVQRGQIHETVVHSEVDWFFNRMGIDNFYFLQNASTIAEHVQTMYAWKVLHETELEENKSASIRFGFERENTAMFVCRSDVTIDSNFDPSDHGAMEQLIESRYFLEGYRTNVYLGKYMSEPFRLKSYRTKGTISAKSPQQLRFYFLMRPTFPGSPVAPDETRLEKLADHSFLKHSTKKKLDIYQQVLTDALSRKSNTGAFFRVFPTEHKDEVRLMVCYKHGTAHSFFSALTMLYDKERLYARKRAVEHLKNGFVLASVHLRALGDLHPLPAGKSLVNVQAAADKVARAGALLFVLPRTALSKQLPTTSVVEICYRFVVWKFAFHFLNRYDEEHSTLESALQAQPDALRHLQSLKSSLRAHSFSEARLLDVFRAEHILPALSALYANFSARHDPKLAKPGQAPADTKELVSLLVKASRSKLEREVLLACLLFNTHLLKTNFYKQDKLAFSFRLDPRFLSAKNYPTCPFAVFFFVGSEFRGFHIRFSDIARGGLRIIKSRNNEEMLKNASGVFDENYNLALTQQKKNKDIPEGGSKGTILLTLDHQHKGAVAFLKYVDSMLDLLLIDARDVVDHYGKREILFCGPDENTANYMDFAAHHARKRGFPYWRAFTTGKSISMGGIPHDMFGMTTRSVHQYVLGVLRKLGLPEERVTKLQTGGPDGDLGSNEILISKDRAVAVVDGSGVLVDPRGINRDELRRLATARLMVEHFDKTKLSPDGHLVLLTARGQNMGDGEKVANGLMFRNTFHLNPRAEADIFVPCGGRPASINIHNYTQLLDPTGKPRFKAIIEGANLFLTQDARLALEKAGVILYKDASANKGGVTSSSCEVLACLALSEEQHKDLMQVPNNDPTRLPAFYKRYVDSVIEVIENNARMEFEAVWREHERTKVPRCLMTDMLSKKINSLNQALTSSKLWNNTKLKHRTIEHACPKVLIELLGVDTILKRVPEQYVRAMFGSFLASRYVYQYGLEASEFDFLDFINAFLNGDSKL